MNITSARSSICGLQMLKLTSYLLPCSFDEFFTTICDFFKKPFFTNQRITSYFEKKLYQCTVYDLTSFFFLLLAYFEAKLPLSIAAFFVR